MFIAIILGNLLAKSIDRPFQKLQETIDYFANNDALPKDASIEKENFYFAELNQLRKSLGKAFSALQEKRTIEKALSECAAQVSHDIRSPLATLTTILKDVSELPEKKRVIIRNATQRISDIANNLLIQYRVNKNNNENAIEKKLNPELIFSLLDSLVSEKRELFTDKKIDLQLEISDSAYGCFANIDPTDFKRMMSNLINNAAESFELNGVIRVTLENLGENLIIKIIDNGRGIPEDLLPKIKQGGTSIGKKEGSGLGISGAIQNIKKWHGMYEIDSKIGTETTFTIKLPLTEEPRWFQANIVLLPKTHVVVLDDDKSIHPIWEIHFHEYLKNEQITLHHFYKPADFVEYCNNSSLDQHLFLVDFELIGFKETGLDLIEQLNLKSKAILVTSRYEEPNIRERVEKLNVKIIPKNFAPYIPISMITDIKQPELIFIDDDKLLTAAWEERALAFNKLIATFNSSGDFKKIMSHYDKNIPIYIDSDLREHLSGENFAKFLYGQGFHFLYLATGYDESKFGAIPWVKEIVNKEPPF
jgi:signal transduction histidine kinase